MGRLWYEIFARDHSVAHKVSISPRLELLLSRHCCLEAAMSRAPTCPGKLLLYLKENQERFVRNDTTFFLQWRWKSETSLNNIFFIEKAADTIFLLRSSFFIIREAWGVILCCIYHGKVVNKDSFPGLIMIAIDSGKTGRHLLDLFQWSRKHYYKHTH